MNDVALLCHYFFGPSAGAARRDLLAADPAEAAREAVAQLGPGLDLDRAVTIASTLAALVRVSTVELSLKRESASRRVAGSMRSMARVHFLALALNGLIFLSGVVFVLVAIWLGWEGRLEDAVVAGSIGVLDVALGLLTRPQRGVHESAMDQLQIQVAYNAFIQKLDQLGGHYDWQAELDSLPAKEAVATMMYRAAAEAATQIERYAKSSSIPEERP